METTHRSIAYSILDLAIISKGCSAADIFHRTLGLARIAESLGYRRFWLAEHHNAISIASSATSILIGYVAEGTSSIRVGSGGIMLPNHAPLIVAEQFGTLATLYPNRIDLGLGRAPGTDQLTAQAIRPDRMTSVYQFPQEIAQIQQYLSADNSGSKVRVPFAEGVDLPVYVLGSSTDSAHLAAAKGLPYAFASHFAPGQLMEALSIYRREFRPSAVLDQPYAMACINVMVADEAERAEMLLTSLIRLFLNILTGKSDYLQPPVEMDEELREVWQHPSVQQMLKYTFAGDRATVQQKTEEFLAQTGVDEVIVASHIYDHEERVRSYQLFSEIMQAVNSRKELV